MIWKCGAFEFDTRMPVIMGILNVTPDSFSGDGMLAVGGVCSAGDACAASESAVVRAALDRAREMRDAGAQIIDVGGESSRPGAEAVCADEELGRALPVVRALAQEGFCVSIDTRHAAVARAAVEAGASIVNDVTGFTDEKMRRVAAESDAGIAVTHCGRHFEGILELECADVVDEVRDWLAAQTAALEAEGVARNRICVDFGPGFGKSVRQTIELVYNFHEFRHLGYPVMAALSRKRFISEMYRIGKTAPEAASENGGVAPAPEAAPEEADAPAPEAAPAPADPRDAPSAEQALMACELGAGIVRTHNVEATAAALRDLRPYCIVSLGCNVPLVAEPGEEQEAKIAQLNLAVSDLSMLPDTQLVDVSPFYESEPAYYLDQDSFVNGVALLRTGIAPKELLDYLHAIENSLGRVREIENGPRTLDLDIVDYQTYVVESEVLTLPHLRTTERDFVVKPLEDILPGHILADGALVASVPEENRIGRAVRIGAGR